MKPPRPKIHLADFGEPLLNYDGIYVMCGVTLAHAELISSIQQGADVAVAVPRSRECTTCRTLAETQPESTGKRWWYWLIEGAENLGASEGDNEP